MAKNKLPQAQAPLILRCHRLMEAFAKSDEERLFYVDKVEGFLLYIDLDKSQEELDAFEKERSNYPERYVLIPRMTFYETKKLMENFVTEKVYDIDTKEKLLDIIQSKEARENFLEFVSDHHSEYEKWQQFYQERSRIQIIEWLRSNHFHFVFEEDLDLPKSLIEKVKQSLFELKVAKELQAARSALIAKAKSYYSNEALNPRPKRGRPPKQAIKLEVEPQASRDIYTTVSPIAMPFLFTPEITGAAAVSFSSKFDNQAEALRAANDEIDKEQSLEEKLLALRSLTSSWSGPKGAIEEDEDEDEDEEIDILQLNGKAAPALLKRKVETEKKGSGSKTKNSSPIKNNSQKKPPIAAKTAVKGKPAAIKEAVKQNSKPAVKAAPPPPPQKGKKPADNKVAVKAKASPIISSKKKAAPAPVKKNVVKKNSSKKR